MCGHHYLKSQFGARKKTRVKQITCVKTANPGKEGAAELDLMALKNN